MIAKRKLIVKGGKLKILTERYKAGANHKCIIGWMGCQAGAKFPTKDNNNTKIIPEDAGYTDVHAFRKQIEKYFGLSASELEILQMRNDTGVSSFLKEKLVELGLVDEDVEIEIEKI